MSILIKGMEMPTSCAECRFYGEYCHAKDDENKHSKLPCPLVHVPDHGRLVDADALTAKLKEMGFGEHSLIERLFADGVYLMIDYAPTIIPAEGRETQAGN